VSNVYGIQTEDDCRAKIDELLALNAKAEETLSREDVGAVKARLAALCDEADDKRMSKVEASYFWPAIRDAHLHAPHLGQPRTWRSKLDDIEWYLNYWRPKTS
jgi:hypothetical protein